MLSSRTSIILILAILVAIMAVAQCRNIQYDVEEISPETAFRYAQWGEIPHKRVPSAGDMMVSKKVGSDVEVVEAKDSAIDTRSQSKVTAKVKPWQRKEYTLVSTNTSTVVTLTESRLPSIVRGLWQQLELFQNARVMLIRNINSVEGLVNGLTGTLENINVSNGEVESLEIRARYELLSGEKRVRTQFPVEVSFATSIHKSQGLTLKNVILSTTKIFAFAHFYVGCSRIQSLEGLHLINLNVDKVKVNPAAIVEYDSLRKLNTPEDSVEMAEDNQNTTRNNHSQEHIVDGWVEPLLLDNDESDCFVNVALNMIYACRGLRDSIVSYDHAHPTGSLPYFPT